MRWPRRQIEASERVEFCDSCSRVVTQADCSRSLVDKTRDRAISEGRMIR